VSSRWTRVASSWEVNEVPAAGLASFLSPMNPRF
jgi:hypothetical protein